MSANGIAEFASLAYPLSLGIHKRQHICMEPEDNRLLLTNLQGYSLKADKFMDRTDHTSAEVRAVELNYFITIHRANVPYIDADFKISVAKIGQGTIGVGEFCI